MALRSGTRLGPYEVSGFIGAGGMGEVYRAKDTRLGRSVALKVLPAEVASDPERRKRFEHEARSVSALNHPNICALYDIGSATVPDSGTLDYIVMELLEGPSLADRIARGALPLREALEYGAQIADALGKAHRQGVVHRDIKPGNIILTKEGAKLLDFGLAKGRHAGAGEDIAATMTVTSQPLTQPGMIVGTVPYMAPEQLNGRDADARTDIFAFGAVLYEMLSGRRAFQGEGQASVIAGILTAEPPALAAPPLNVPPAVERLVRQCLAKDPDRRLQSAADIARYIEGILEELRTLSSSGQISVAAALPQSWTRRIVRVSIGVLLATSLGVGGFLVGKKLTERPIPSFHRLTFRRGTVESARFTPDGQSVVYTARWDGRPRETFTIRADSVDSVAREGLQGYDLLAISPKNELALGRAFALSTAPLAAGAPREVQRPVTDADFSPDGSQLAVIRMRNLEYPPGTVIYKPRTQLLNLSGVRVSPKGDLLAVIEHTLTHGKVVVLDPTGKVKVESSFCDGITAVCWTPAADEVWFPAITPAGREVIRAMDLKGRERSVLRVPGMALRDISRDGKVLLTAEDVVWSTRGKAPGEAAEHDLTYYGWSLVDSISPDGRTIMFSEGGESDPSNGWSVYLRGTDGSAPQRLGAGFSGRLSPDGKWVVTTSVGRDVKAREAEFVTAPKLVLLPTGAGEPRTIADSQPEGKYVVDWLPDSSGFVYASGRRLWFAPVDGRAPTAVTPEGWAGGCVAPSGKHVLASPISPTDRNYYLYSIDGREKTVIPTLFRNEWRPIGVHDARRIRVLPVRLGAREQEIQLPLKVCLFDLQTGKAEPWKELGEQLPRAGLSGSGILQTRVFFSADGEGYAYSFGHRFSTLYTAEGLR
ncbi:MAG: serine/threonine protein kinase [Bacteroidetes bacterium]|nr:serine/threonine protein kinase [Bacteroidota bacterium]